MIEGEKKLIGKVYMKVVGMIPLYISNQVHRSQP